MASTSRSRSSWMTPNRIVIGRGSARRPGSNARGAVGDRLRRVATKPWREPRVGAATPEWTLRPLLQGGAKPRDEDRSTACSVFGLPITY